MLDPITISLGAAAARTLIAASNYLFSEPEAKTLVEQFQSLTKKQQEGKLYSAKKLRSKHSLIPDLALNKAQGRLVLGNGIFTPNIREHQKDIVTSGERLRLLVQPALMLFASSGAADAAKIAETLIGSPTFQVGSLRSSFPAIM